jgi:citronellol/citronellal dehydrogenase
LGGSLALKIRGKIAIVTGASRGLGKAIGMGLAKEGTTVVVVGRTEIEREGLTGTIYKTTEEIRAFGGYAIAIKCDITKENEICELVRQSVANFRTVDILVNNTGIVFPAPISEMSLKRWELILRVNLTGTFLCTKAVLLIMLEKRRGSIINISSIQAEQKGSVSTGIAYGVSKAGIERFIRGLAEELREFNIAVNCVKPRGAVETEGMRFLNPHAYRSRWDTPDMMVKATAFLASQDAKGATGTVATDEEICTYHGLL